MEYAVTIDLVATGRRRYTQTHAEQLANLGGAASLEDDGSRLSTTQTITAADAPAAGARAIRRLAELVAGDVVALEVLTVDEQDRRLAQPAVELAGVAEVAELLGVTRQRASMLQIRPDFPAPVATLRSGPVWRAADLATFATTWERKPGRPRKAAAPADVA